MKYNFRPPFLLKSLQIGLPFSYRLYTHTQTIPLLHILSPVDHRPICICIHIYTHYIYTNAYRSKDFNPEKRKVGSRAILPYITLGMSMKGKENNNSKKQKIIILIKTG